MNSILGITTKYLDGRVVTRFVDDVAMDGGKFAGFSAGKDHREAMTFTKDDPRVSLVLHSIASEDIADLLESGRESVTVAPKQMNQLVVIKFECSEHGAFYISGFREEDGHLLSDGTSDPSEAMVFDTKSDSKLIRDTLAQYQSEMADGTVQSVTLQAA